MKKIYIILVLSLILISGCKKDNNTITMVTEAGFAPYEYYENGEIVGVDIEVAKQIAKSLGKELVVKDVSFDSIINELKSGKADFAAAGMSVTEERKKQVDFTIEYVTSRQVVIVKDNSSIKDNSDIYDKTVAVQLGSTADMYLSDSKFTSIKLNRQKKYLSMIEDLKSGKVDAVVMDGLPASEIVKANDGIKVLSGELFTDKYGIAVKKGNKKLLNNINNVLNELIKDGKIEEYTLQYSK